VPITFAPTTSHDVEPSLFDKTKDIGMEEIRDLLDRGLKPEAVWKWRQHHADVSLPEAKAAIEALMAEHSRVGNGAAAD